jgi:hypothetical protein
VGRGRAIGEPQWFGSVRVEGRFDSGIDEIILECPRGASERVKSLQPEDASTYPPQP